MIVLQRKGALVYKPALALRQGALHHRPSGLGAEMANTKNVEDRNLRKSLKRSQRTRLKAVEATLTLAQRRKLRRTRKEEFVGTRAFLEAEKKAAAKAE